jgi:hypothetical protein
MASSVNVVFNADTGQYVANVDKGSAAVVRSAEAVAKAKNEITASFKMQVQAAKEVGASHQELESIQRRAATMMASVTEQNATRVVNALDRIATKNKQVAAELGNLKMAAPLPGGSGHQVSDRMAASATVRGLETGNPGIRSVENFITTIPGAAQAMQSLFPIIGAAGLAGLLIDMGISGYEAFEKVRKAADVTRDAFGALHDKSMVFIDDKEIENQKIQDQINKISGKPNNGIALALLEAKKMADQFLVSLQADRKEIEGIFKEHDTGTFGAALSFFGLGTHSTKTQEKEIGEDYAKLLRATRAAKEQYAQDLKAAPDDAAREAVTKAYNAKTTQLIDSQIATYKKEIKRLKDNTFGINGISNDPSGQIANLEGVIDVLQNRESATLIDESIYSGNKKLGGLKQNKEGDEVARKAAEKQREQWDIEHDQWEQAAQRSAADEVAFWTGKVNAVGVGSLNYKTALDKQTEAIRTQRTKDAETAKQSAAKALKDQREAWDLDHDAWTQAGHRTAADEADYWGIRTLEAETGSENYKAAYDKMTAALLAAQRAEEEASRARNKAVEQQNTQRAALAQASLAIQEQTGQISRHDAALQLASIHAELYRQQLAALQNELRNQTAIDPKSGASINAQAAVDKATADRRVQVMQDAANAAATTWQGALKNANAVWVQDAQDSAKQVTQLFEQAISGLNDNLANLMVGDKSNFAGMFKGIGKTLANDSLKRLEAPILGALGMGKADGSTNNPFYVKIVSGIGGNAGAGWLSGLLGGSSDDSSDSSSGGKSSSGGFLSTVGSFIGSMFGGHFALGGNVQAGVPIDVGEMGRETFIPQTNGTIVPHNKVGGSVAYYTVNVANGVTPEQMRMHMNDALREFHPVVIGDSIKANRAYQQRNPSSAR